MRVNQIERPREQKSVAGNANGDLNKIPDMFDILDGVIVEVAPDIIGRSENFREILAIFIIFFWVRTFHMFDVARAYVNRGARLENKME
jgi:hypothetical protein